MREQLVSFEVAKAAKDLGYMIPSDPMFEGDKLDYGNDNEYGADEDRLQGKFSYNSVEWYACPHSITSTEMAPGRTWYRYFNPSE